VNLKIKIIIIVVAISITIMMWPSFLGGNTDVFVVDGHSMLPTILPGSIVITKKQSDYQVDDIVAYKLTEGRLSKNVVHRIIEETENGFKIQGDNNEGPDPGFWKNDKIIGKTVFVMPYVGYAFSLIRNPIVMVVGSIVIMLVQHEIKKRKKGSKRQRYGTQVMPAGPVPSQYAGVAKKRGPNYTLFFIANALNILVYVVQQIALTNEKKLTGDFITGIFYSNLEGSIASSISFAAYFVIFVLLYIFVKRKEETYVIRSYGTFSQRHAVKNPALKIIQVVWLLFALMESVHLIVLLGALR
jgi:signal peptidase